MTKLSETETKYDSVMEFALLGRDDEKINLKTISSDDYIEWLEDRLEKDNGSQAGGPGDELI